MNILYNSLDNNELKFLEAESIAGLKKLKTLGLDNNPWQCDCHLRDFCRLITAGSSNRLYAVPQNCVGPARLQGRRWEDVKPSEFACEPTVLLPISSIQEEINGNVSLACLASGDPEPEVWWQLNGGPLNGTRRANDEVGAPGKIALFTSRNILLLPYECYYLCTLDGDVQLSIEKCIFEHSL